MSYLDTDWSLVDFNEPKKPAEKGTCPKCGKPIGKGIHSHMKACNGDRSSTR